VSDNINRYKLHDNRQNEYLKQLSEKEKKSPISIAHPPKFVPNCLLEKEEEIPIDEAELMATMKQAKYKTRPNSSKMSRNWSTKHR